MMSRIKIWLGVGLLIMITPCVILADNPYIDCGPCKEWNDHEHECKNLPAGTVVKGELCCKGEYMPPYPATGCYRATVECTWRKDRDICYKEEQVAHRLGREEGRLMLKIPIAEQQVMDLGLACGTYGWFMGDSCERLKQKEEELANMKKELAELHPLLEGAIQRLNDCWAGCKYK